MLFQLLQIRIKFLGERYAVTPGIVISNSYCLHRREIYKVLFKKGEVSTSFIFISVTDQF